MPFYSEHSGDVLDAAVALVDENLMTPTEGRTYLELGAAATKNLGTTAGTVASGDDSRIVGAAQKSANLSDLGNAGTARTNLGLGTAAVLTAGAANGAATLDSGGKVPTSQLPASVVGGVQYQGTWNANTNSPAISSGTGTTGHYYRVSVAGTTTVDGVSDWGVGDWIVFNGTTWDKIDNTEQDATMGVNGNVRLAGDLGGSGTTAAAPKLSADAATDTVIGTRTINDTLASEADTGPLTSSLSWLAKMIKGITGESGWKSAPATTVAALATPYRTLWIGAEAMVARTTNGAATGSTESATHKIMIESFDFDSGTQEYAQFKIAFPDEWNRGTLKIKFFWSAGSSSGDVVWGIQAGALSNDDAIDAALGTAVEVTDTLTATNDVCVTAATSAMTVGGSPALGDMLVFQIYRKAADSGDTLGADAKLLGVQIQYRETTPQAAW